MHIEESEILNFCRLRQRTDTWHAGLTAIIGANGAGKSNLLGAIRYLLTGENPNAGTKAQNIAQLAPETEQSYVRGIFSHGGARFEIKRWLRPAGNKPELRMLSSPEPVIRGEDAVNTRIKQILGIEFDILNEMVLVAQDDILGFLDLTPAKRAASFQRLFRTDAAEEISGVVQKQLATVPLIVPSTTPEECRANIGVAEQSFTAWQAAGQQQRPVAAIQADRDNCVKVIGNYEARQAAGPAIASDTQQLSALQRERGTYAAMLHDQEVDRAAIANVRAAHTDSVEAAKTALANLANYRQMEQSRAAIQAGRAADREKLLALVEPVRPANYESEVVITARCNAAAAAQLAVKNQLQGPDLETARLTLAGLTLRQEQLIEPQPPEGYTADDASRDRRRYDAEQAVLKATQLVATFSEGVAECPTCHTPTQNLLGAVTAAREALPALQQAAQLAAGACDMATLYKQAKTNYALQSTQLAAEIARWLQQVELWQRVAPLHAEIRDASAVYMVSRDYDQASQKHANDLAELTRAIAKWDQQEAALRILDQPNVVETELQALISTQAEQDRQLLAIDTAIITTRTELARLDGQITQFQTSLAMRQRTLASVVDVSPEEWQQAEHGKQQFAAELQLRHTADNNLLLAKHSWDAWKAALVTAEQQAARAAQLQAWGTRGAALRDLFHHANLPRFVAHRNLQRLEGSVNEFLELFQAEFRVSADEGLSFEAIFMDGRRHAADRLSIGQKVVLAMAFRLAVNLMFAENIGFLALDEPTASLDEHHIRGFEPVLAQLRTFAAARGLQCVIITHERSLAPLFDAVMQL